MFFIIGLILVISVCNDTATFAQVIGIATLGFALMIPSVLLSKQQYHLDFVAPNGRHKKIRVRNLLGKLLVTHKYAKLGYTLQAEWELV